MIEILEEQPDDGSFDKLLRGAYPTTRANHFPV
jgi:hypothetical protein